MRALGTRAGCGILLALTWVAGLAAGADPAGVAFFEQKVRPVLVQHCFTCHSAQARKVRGGLLLDTRAGLLKGGDSGPAIVPGRPAESLLLKALRHDGLAMPPKGKLPDTVLADFEHWIRLDAPDPRDGKAASVRAAIDLEAGRRFWAFQPPRRPRLPEVADTAWPRSAIDRFILAPLEARGLKPAPDANRRTLIRRATFDLIGLPPTLEETAAFLHDPAPDPEAFVKVVDRLLASPHFGERWARHWLDVARYADSSGGGRSLLFPDAWRYRDYVIEAFNTDAPYNQLITEQVAGDLLPFDTPAQRCRQLAATAFLALGPTNYERQDKDGLEMDVIDEQIDTIGRAFLGLTLGCARCHDHKFDPIPTRDYYALAGIFKSTQTLVHDNVSHWVDQPLPVSPTQEAALREHEAAVAALKKKISVAKAAATKNGKAVAAATQGPGTAPPAGEVKSLEAELKRLTAAGPQRPLAMSVREAATVGDCHICIRGNTHNQGELVPRGFLQVLGPGRAPALPAGASGRRELAAWLASAENPLTARVMANRVWHWLFGAGLVRTVDEFGATGERPSHPELLDYLALHLSDEGWSVKRLVRAIVLSRTYQLSSADRASAATADPDNRLLGHRSRRRLDAEALRDAMLVVSGRLDRTLGGPTIRPGTTAEYGYRFDDHRRSLYTPVFRNRSLELFEVFDFADPNRVVGRRGVSTVPTQALYLLNSPFVMDQARSAAEAALAVPDLDDAGRLDRTYATTLGRPPSENERRLALDFLAGAPPGQRQAAWERLFQALFACIAFRYVD